MVTMSKNARVFAAIAAIFVWLVLAVQFCLQLINAGVDVLTGERIVRFFSYFRNVGLVLIGFLAVGMLFVAVAKFLPGRTSLASS
jgi:hypothetical protein